jgi:hypothetical protein
MAVFESLGLRLAETAVDPSNSDHAAEKQRGEGQTRHDSICEIWPNHYRVGMPISREEIAVHPYQTMRLLVAHGNSMTTRSLRLSTVPSKRLLEQHDRPR